jgi:hypothetical protein
MVYRNKHVITRTLLLKKLVFEKYLSLLSPHNLYIHVFVSTNVVVTDRQLRQEGGTLYLEMIGCVTFVTQKT